MFSQNLPGTRVAKHRSMRAKLFLIICLSIAALTQLERESMRAYLFARFPSLQRSNFESMDPMALTDRGKAERVSPRKKFLTLAKEDDALAHDQIVIERLDVPAQKAADEKDHYYLRLSIAGVSVENVDLSFTQNVEPTITPQDRELRVYDDFGSSIESKVDRDLRFLKLARLVDLAKSMEFRLKTGESEGHLDFLPHGEFPVSPANYGSMGFEFRLSVMEDSQFKIPTEEFNTCNLGSPYLELVGIDQGSSPFYSVNRDPASLRTVLSKTDHPVRYYRISTGTTAECEDLKGRVRFLTTSLRRDMTTQSVTFPNETKMIPISAQVLAIQLDSLTGKPEVRVDNL